MGNTIFTRIKKSIANSRGDLFMTRDLRKFGHNTAVAESLKRLVDEGVLYRFGYGVYAKAKIGIISNSPVPVQPLEELTAQFLDKMGVKWRLGRAQREYNEGKTTQIPVTSAFDIGKRRITRKLTIGARSTRYERS
ncbi:MAG: type IV toxin-antitoxin system AbiEi family antitoxin domain-containing protein [Desulfovibrio sp.]|jgi:hypothetical protein|nr:type IV toxin-antitoxin system AbiEi family antitoxin domain-containing protein [Desulfovibrio sp.]